MQYYRASKAEILQLRKDHVKSEQSRIRFEARQERLEREEAEKEAKRAARKKAAEERAKQAASADGDEAAEDPIQAAIERAKAKKAAQQNGTTSETSPLEKLEQAVASTRKRLATAVSKLDEAKETGSDLVDALQTGVDKTRAKLDKAEQALREHQASGNTQDQAAAAESTTDPARLAIEKAMAARAAEAELSPEEKSRMQREKLEQRLAKARERLVTGRAAGEEDKILEALEATVARLEEKITDASEALPQEQS